MGVGAAFHCDHSMFTGVTKMPGWRAFHYMTNVTIQSFNKFLMKAPESMATFEFIPVDAGHTKLCFRVRCLRRDWFTIQFMRHIVKHLFINENIGDYNRPDSVFASMQHEQKESE